MKQIFKFVYGSILGWEINYSGDGGNMAICPKIQGLQFYKDFLAIPYNLDRL